LAESSPTQFGAVRTVELRLRKVLEVLRPLRSPRYQLRMRRFRLPPPRTPRHLKSSRARPSRSHRRANAPWFSRLGHLRGAAEAYLKSGLLLVPSGLTRRKARAFERALLLLIAEHRAADRAQLPSWFHERSARLLRKGWEDFDQGRGARDVGRV
jgi:hypothetical protein